MAAALAQNKTLKVLSLTSAQRDDDLLSQAKGRLTQSKVMKEFIEHLMLGVSLNTTLERVYLEFPPWLSGHIMCELLLQQCWALFYFSKINTLPVGRCCCSPNDNVLLLHRVRFFHSVLHPKSS